MESSVRYGTLVWIGWYLYYTQHFQEMGDYLKQSWQYRSFSATETVINWTESFAVFSKNWGIKYNVYHLTQLPEWQELMRWTIEERIKA